MGKAKKPPKNGAKTKTLNDVLKDKDAETRKLREEELMYNERKKERGKRIIQIEKVELHKREEEVNNLKENLEEEKARNEEAEKEIQAQIKSLQIELDGLKLQNRTREDSLKKKLMGRLRDI